MNSKYKVGQFIKYRLPRNVEWRYDKIVSIDPIGRQGGMTLENDWWYVFETDEIEILDVDETQFNLLKS